MSKINSLSQTPNLRPLAVKVTAEEQQAQKTAAFGRDTVVRDDAIIYSMRDAIIYSAADAQKPIDKTAIIITLASAEKVG